MKKKPGTPTPHDATFRQFLANPDVARDFMMLHLPAELRALCDLTTLKLESGTFVEDDLRQYVSDILWSMKTTTGDDGYIHLLLEHQSSADKNMAFRQLRYAVAAMQRHLEAGHKKRHCCKVSDEAAFCLIQRPYISKTLLTRRISPRGSP